MFHKVIEQAAGRRIKDLCANGHPYGDVCTLVSGAIRTLAVPATTGYVQRVVTKVQQCVQRFIGLQPHVTPFAAVATGGTATGHEFLAPESSNAVTAVAALHANFGSINKHRKSKATPTALEAPAGVAFSYLPLVYAVAAGAPGGVGSG